MKNINISPALLTDIQKIFNQYGYNFKNAFLNEKQGNHRYIFNNELIEIELKIKNIK